MADKTVVVRFVARVGKYISQMRAVAAETAQVGRGLEAGASRTVSSAKTFAAASAFAGKAILLGIGGALAVGAKAAIDFESAMAGVAKTVDASQGEIDALGEALREMSLTTPVSVLELAKIAEIGGQLGVPLEMLEDFTEVIAALGVTTNLSVEDAATGLARFANVMGTSFSDFEVLGSILVELGNNFATTESEILTFATRLAPVGAVVGATEAEILALSAGLSALGIPAERGSTAIQRTFVDMEKAIEGGGEKLERFAEVAGVTVEEFENLTAVDRLLKFVDGLGMIERRGGSAIDALLDLSITGQRQISTLLGMSTAFDVFRRAVRDANSEVSDPDALFEEAAKRYGTTEQQIRLLVNAFNDLRIEIGEETIPMLRDAIGWFRDFFAGLKENFDTVRSFAVNLAKLGLGAIIARIAASFLAAAGTMFSAFGAAKVATFVTRLGLISSALGGLIGLGIAGLAIAFGKLAMSWGDSAKKARILRDAAKELADLLEEGVDTETITEFFERRLAEMGIEVTNHLRQMLVDAKLSFAGVVNEFATAGEDSFINFRGHLLSTIRETQKEMDEITGGQPMVGARGALLLPEDRTRLEDLRRKHDAAEALHALLTGASEISRELDDEQALRRAESATERRAEGIQVLGESVLFATDFLGLMRGFDLDLASVEGRIRSQLIEAGAGPEVWDDFAEGVGEAVSDMNQFVSDAFDDISESVLSSIDPFEEYERAAAISSKAVITSLRNQVADLQAWADLADRLTGQVSGTTLSFLEAQDLSVRAGLAALFAEDEDAFDALIAEFEATMGEDGILFGIADQMFTTKLPGIARTGIASLTKALQEEIALLTEADVDPDLAVAGAWLNVFEQLPENQELREAYMTAMLSSLAPDQLKILLEELGEELPASIAKGIRNRLWELRDAAAHMGREVERVVRAGLIAKSPSKVMMRLGEDISEGLRLGLTSNDPFAPLTQQLQQLRTLPPFTPTNVSNVRSVEITINNPITKDLKEDLQSPLVLAQVTQLVDLDRAAL